MNQNWHKNGKNDEEFYDELIKQRIAEALKNQSSKERLDLETLERWVAKDKERRKLKNRVKRLWGLIFK